MRRGRSGERSSQIGERVGCTRESGFLAHAILGRLLFFARLSLLPHDFLVKFISRCVATLLTHISSGTQRIQCSSPSKLVRRISRVVQFG